MRNNLRSNDELLLNMIISDKEADPVKKEITKHLEEVKKLASKISCGSKIKNQISSKRSS